MMLDHQSIKLPSTHIYNGLLLLLKMISESGKLMETRNLLPFLIMLLKFPNKEKEDMDVLHWPLTVKDLDFMVVSLMDLSAAGKLYQLRIDLVHYEKRKIRNMEA